MASRKRPGNTGLMGKRHPSQPPSQSKSKPRSQDNSCSESDDPKSLGRDLDRCARLLHQMLESDGGGNSRQRSQSGKKVKMCKKEEGRRSGKSQSSKTQSNPRAPLAAVENQQKPTPTLIITTPSGKFENQEPSTPQAHFNRRLSSSTPEPCKQFQQEPQWNLYYQQQYQQPARTAAASQVVVVTLPSSPVNYSVNQAPALTACTHPSSVHPTTTYTTPIPTTQQGGNSPSRGHHPVSYPSGYMSYPGVYHSGVQYHQASHGHHSSHHSSHHSPPTRLGVDQETFRSLANRHFTDANSSPRTHASPPQRYNVSPPHQQCGPVPPVCPPRQDSPRPLDPVDESPELADRQVADRTVHFESPPRENDVCPPYSTEHDALQDSKVTFSTDNVRNRMATLHYLLGELRVLADGDAEVSRLVGEVQTTVEEVSPLRSATSFQAEVELSLQPLRSENSQLRRRLRILNHQLKEREKKEKENVRPDTNFDVAHVQAKYESLQSKYNEEKQKNSRLQQDVYRMEGQLEEVKVDRAKVVMQMSEKETEQMKIKHDWLHETTSLKKDLDSYSQRMDEMKHKCELLEREKHILQLTIQQRDTDLTRVQDLLHDYKNRYHTKSSPTVANLSPTAATPSRLTRQALEEFNNSPQNNASSGHKSPIERLGLENPKTPGCSPKLISTKDTKRPSSDRSRGSREDKREKSQRLKSPLGASMGSSTPQKKHMTITTELDNSNLSSVSRDSRCTSPTLVSTNVPSASQVNGQAVMPTMTSRPTLDSTVSSVSTDASTITMTAINQYQPSTLGTELTVDSKLTAPSHVTQDSIFKSQQESRLKHDETDRYSVTDYFHKYGSSAVERYQSSSAGTGATFMSTEDSKSDITLMTNSSLSSINSQDDRSFRAGLANLDANIARLQMALRTSPSPR